MTLINPINPSQQQSVIDLTQQYIQSANSIYQRRFPNILVQFDLIGRAAGMYCVQGSNRYIRYNPYLFAKYFINNQAETIPHEVAHYITDKIYGLANIRPHGKEWTQLMHAFGVPANRTGNYDLTGIPTRQHRRFAYRCRCNVHQLTTRRHHQILRHQAHYVCRYCQQTLTLLTTTSPNTQNG